MFGSSGTSRQSFEKMGFRPPLPPRPDRTPTASVVRFVATDSSGMDVYFKRSFIKAKRAVRPQMGSTCTPPPASPESGVRGNPYKNRTATVSDMKFLCADFPVPKLRVHQVSIRYH